MHGRSKRSITTTTTRSTASLARGTGAVTWIDSTRAVVARTAKGGVSVKVISHDPDRAAPRVPFLTRVVDAIGDRDRVLILGPDAMRVSLEREYVTIYHRPDRLVDVEVSGPAGEEELVRRLEALTGG